MDSKSYSSKIYKKKKKEAEIRKDLHQIWDGQKMFLEVNAVKSLLLQFLWQIYER